MFIVQQLLFQSGGDCMRLKIMKYTEFVES
jgi:hypothetical protein